MHININRPKVFGVRQSFIVRVVAIGVALNAILIVLGTLLDALLLRTHFRNTDVTVAVPILIGLTLLYLSRLLYRRKRTAWVVAVPLYALILAINLIQILGRSGNVHLSLESFLRNILLPVLVVAGLLLTEKEFTVKSDLRSFASSLRFIVLIGLVTLIYGVVGFQLLDDNDFHQEISVAGSFQRTVDQFNFTTSHPLVPYTRRARLFLDSLSIISVGAVGYGMVSLFQPLKARFVDQSHNRAIMRALLERYPANSEDVFKIWPHDKVYFINYESTAGLAFHVSRGIALVVGDPAGDVNEFPSLIRQFDELCFVNDWTPAFIHTEEKYSKLYETNEFSIQKLGEEAILDIEHFTNSVLTNKYFRHIKNKFEKAGYTSEILVPPHSHFIMDRLKTISDEWLKEPGREERGFIMGYYSSSYLQQCPVMVARDKDGVIQAFLNQIHSFEGGEANFDMLRHTTNSLGNINDFLLINFIAYAKEKGFTKLNLGLCPLSGLDNNSENTSIIDSALKFAYANGDRLYSFSGLRKFKSKYEPIWSSRYLIYRGGITGFSRTITALNSAWKVRFRT